MVSLTSPSPPPLPSLKNLLVTFPHPGVCHLQLNRPPVNAINLAVWKELLETLTHLEAHLFPHTARTLVISSNLARNVFSAGNDLSELYPPSTTKQRFFNFFTANNIFLARLYKSPLYTIAALHGATPAAGFMMSLCCDYRLASKDTVMGLNEVAIGLSVPPSWARLLVTMACRSARAEEILASGTMITSTEAVTLGLVDKLVNKGTAVEVQREAIEVGKKWAARTEQAEGRAETKIGLRGRFAQEWEDGVEDITRRAWEQLSQENVVRLVGKIMKELGQKPTARM
eukprot:GFKZ01003938.1.p2 GENE.GFKZ01003938.1~~GFKZ01003938.1.p2  ORF type:complete len:286 (-),score=35.96 GFKZ01003938.1:1089-1946(-)